jgi:hypothetical protein
MTGARRCAALSVFGAAREGEARVVQNDPGSAANIIICARLKGFGLVFLAVGEPSASRRPVAETAFGVLTGFDSVHARAIRSEPGINRK